MTPTKAELKLAIAKLGLAKVEGKIDTLDIKIEQLNTRIGNVEFAVRGVLIGLAVVVLGGFARFFSMPNKLSPNFSKPLHP